VTSWGLPGDIPAALQLAPRSIRAQGGHADHGLVLAQLRFVLRERIGETPDEAGANPSEAESHPAVDPLGRERRFLPTDAQVSTFIDALTTGPVPDAASQVARPTWTTYLDTSDRRYLRSCDGPIARRLRIREYEGATPGDQAAPCYLELKQTVGTSRSKVRLAAPIAVLARLVAGDPLEGLLRDREPGDVALRELALELAQGPLAPCVGTSYQRRCLVAGPALRVTLDEDLTFFHPGALGAPHASQAALAVGPSWVLEVKYGGLMPAWLSDALAGLDELPELSKFRLGMMAVQQATRLSLVPWSGPARSPRADVPAVAPSSTAYASEPLAQGRLALSSSRF
jgi:hypothetical protein